MTQEEILDYNKRCAEFMYPNAKAEYESGKISVEDGVFKKGMLIYGHFHMMRYHSDWNWIMDVVEAIEKIDRNDEHGKFRLIRYGTSCCWNNLPPSINGDSPKEAVVEAINKFLIWYNENNRNI